MNNSKKSNAPIIKILISLGWLLLAAMLIQRDVIIGRVDIRAEETLSHAETEEFQSIFFQGKKIGYVSTTYQQQNDSSLLLQQQAEMTINVADHIQHINLQLNAILSNSNVLQNFTFEFTSPFYRMTASGKVSGNSVQYTLNTASNTIQNNFSFTSPPRLATSRRKYLLSPDIKKGEKKKIPWFDPVTLTGKESIVEYRGVEAVLVNGRVLKLHRFAETFSGIRVNSWLNNEGIVVKEESPAGFIFLREPKFKVLSLPRSSDEILSQVAVPVVGSMVNPKDTSISYRIHLPDDVDFDVSGGNQLIKDNIVRVTKAQLPANVGPPRCSGYGNQLGSSPYIQADNQDIMDLAGAVKGEDSNPRRQVEKIGLWVYENIDKRAVIGLPDALTTLNSRQGDCNEHAALFAALARSIGVPTRVVAGVTYHKDAFYYHAWNEVCLGDNWIAMDTTINQFPADATHIRFVIGEVQEQVRVGALLGRLTIEPIHSPIQ